MDSLINAAGRALAAGDPLGALKRVALRDDAPALALRGIAMAQLGDFAKAKTLLKSAARAFSPKEAVARARCVVAEAEIALVSRDLGWPEKALRAARTTLAVHGDRVNAAYAGSLEARRLILIGRLDEAERLLAGFDPAPLPPVARVAHELAAAGISVRRLRTKAARSALGRASLAAYEANIPALKAEVESASLVLNVPVARLVSKGLETPLQLDEVEALLASGTLVIDACRNVVRQADTVVSLATRPVLFALARALADAWPADASREVLLRRAFRARHADESHRARLRVEMGRLRAELSALAEVNATAAGFALTPLNAAEVVVLAPPVEEEHGAVLAFLADGESWSSSALALALGASARTVQRALEELSAQEKVQAVGRGRARRWMTPPVTGFPTVLLLPGPLPSD
ncbi:helix-turn-helix domain-containing protein [Mesorhizobium captivum]|uniref:Helix-turn-helix domain-containing protein n=1 Tax=Mesorhizobium captivum TaxID=3072319 RepID=A0ABU4Z7G5_9HYPH|nr:MULTISPECIES: helix-turn-helix domain-containing protein [unclassified Mesorhizobium]MDX8450353.1 helix-turn-helix domain-containing protein [Mesorhizobium sp. VK3C]MDX8495220.1 helix-turn-helix domain-containing protein [Mesorhizobium sp. VK22B]MDX8509484.1 helix-turn-helix domain-containing protein [Mesorhizobium sp. VK22E]